MIMSTQNSQKIPNACQFFLLCLSDNFPEINQKSALLQRNIKRSLPSLMDTQKN